MSFEGVVKVTSELGLHARPASRLAKMVRESGCKVTFLCLNEGEFREAQGDSVISLLALGVGKGMELRVSISGDCEEELFSQIVVFFESFFEGSE